MRIDEITLFLRRLGRSVVNNVIYSSQEIITIICIPKFILNTWLLFINIISHLLQGVIDQVKQNMLQVLEASDKLQKFDEKKTNKQNLARDLLSEITKYVDKRIERDVWLHLVPTPVIYLPLLQCMLY